MTTRLYVIPASHAATTAALMLDYKGIAYKRTDLMPVVSKGALRAVGFPGVTVPALKIEGEKIQGSRQIARALDRIQPEPPLFPADPDARAAVEDAERFGDEELQHPLRQLLWWAFKQDKEHLRGYSEGAHMGVPVGLAIKTGGPLVALAGPLQRSHRRQRPRRPRRPARPARPGRRLHRRRHDRRRRAERRRLPDRHLDRPRAHPRRPEAADRAPPRGRPGGRASSRTTPATPRRSSRRPGSRRPRCAEIGPLVCFARPRARAGIRLGGGMRFAYMDETGNTGRRFDDPDQPIHMILSLVVDESKVADLHEHVREVGRRHCPENCADSEFEFHAGDLFSGDAPFDAHSSERGSRSTTRCCARSSWSSRKSSCAAFRRPARASLREPVPPS